MKSLDVVVLCKLFILQSQGKGSWTYAQLAQDVCLSVGETHASVQRLKSSHLWDDYTKSIIPSSMSEFLIHGIKYAFPAEIGTRERGVPTSHSAPVLRNEISSAGDDVYVWPYVKGIERGLSVKPLSESAPEAALKDETLYALLALIDAIRIGKVRERKIAINKLEMMIGRASGNDNL